jgi:hypothetical protein
MITYGGSAEDAHELIQFLRREEGNLRSLRKLIITHEKTTIYDVNRDGIEFPGLTYGCTALDELLRELGVVFNSKTLHNAAATPDGTKEFLLTARWTWGHDRVL